MLRSHLAGVPGHAAGLLVATVLASIAAAGDEPPGRRAVPPAGPAGPRTRVDGRGDPLPPGALVRLGTARHRQETPIGQIVYSPDGRLVATDGDDHDIRIWDGRDGRLIRRIEVGPALIRVSAFGRLADPGRRQLSTRPRSARLRRQRHLRRGRLGDPDRPGPWPEQDSVRTLALSPDHRLLATATTGGTLRLRDAQDGRESYRFLIGRRDIRRIAFAPSGDRIAALSRDEGHPSREVQVNVLDPRRGRRVARSRASNRGTTSRSPPMDIPWSSVINT